MKTIPQLIYERAKQAPDEASLFYRENDSWVGKSWTVYWDEVLRLAQVLVESGLKRGEVFAICASPSIQWETAQTAAMIIGAVVLGLDPHATDAQIFELIEHSETKGLYIVNELRAVRMKTGLVNAGVRFVLTAEQTAEKIKMASRFEWNSADVSPDDYATLIYSSGTTGRPKGILYRHRQIVLACENIREAFAVHHGKTLCWLPLSNLFQRMLNWIAIESHLTICFVENPAHIMTAIAEVQPSILIGVPRFYEKVYQGIEDTFRAQPHWLKILIRWGLARKIWLRLVRRQALGKNMEFMVTGSAPISAHVQKFFASMGIPLLDAYGVSENVIPVAMNRLNSRKIGTVGLPLSSNTVRISESGEVEIKGPGVFEGYYKTENPRERFTSDGFYRTGDYGVFDKDGFLVLGGRRSDVIVTSTGRKISPLTVEAMFRQIPGVENVLIAGQGRKCLVGLLKMDLTKEINTTALKTMILMLNETLPYYEQVKAWAIVEDGFSIASGELTLNLKLRRKVIEENHQGLLNKLHEKAEGKEAVYLSLETK